MTLHSTNKQIASNFRRLARIPESISDEAVWSALEDNHVMDFNPEDQLDLLREKLGLPAIKGLVNR